MHSFYRPVVLVTLSALTLALVLCVSCKEVRRPGPLPPEADSGPIDQTKAPPPPAVKETTTDVVGAWVLSQAWEGYMGVAIKFKDDGTFLYWFYSDVKLDGEPKYPVTGTWKWKGPVLVLSSTHLLHASRWYVYPYKDELCLLPEYARRWQLKDGKEHEDRLLFRIADFDEADPFARRRQ